MTLLFLLFCFTVQADEVIETPFTGGSALEMLQEKKPPAFAKEKENVNQWGCETSTGEKIGPHDPGAASCRAELKNRVKEKKVFKD